MTLYYNFSVLDYRDFEIEVSDERLAFFLSTITDFTEEEIMSDINGFARLYKTKIHEYFKPLAEKVFKGSIDWNERHARAMLRARDINKRTQALARKKKNMEDLYERD